VAKFQWMAGNLGFYGDDRLASYDRTALSQTGMTLTNDPDLGPLDPTLFAATVEVSFARATSYVIETGPDAGALRITGGTLSGLTYRNAAGDV
jgi:hypothetical protein